jgi:hypothetical protein
MNTSEVGDIARWVNLFIAVGLALVLVTSRLGRRK